MADLKLYMEAQSAWNRDKALQGGNYGLAYDKFVDTWDLKKDERKSEWIGHFAGKLAGDAKLLGDHAVRRGCLVGKLGGDSFWFQTDWAFVTGLGRSHPMENGFAWHHILGVPYLPGSSIKGLLRAWARETGMDRDFIWRVFGPRPSECARGEVFKPTHGTICFHDALPAGPTPLRAEVMTNHFGDWYGTSGSPGWPADWISPNPIPFLAVDPGVVFQLAITKTDCSTRDEDFQWVVENLPEALSELGAGAKTATGYGRFSRCEPPPAIKKRLEDCSKTPEEKRHEELEGSEIKTFQFAVEVMERFQAGEDVKSDLKLLRMLSHPKKWRLGNAKSDEVRAMRGGEKTLKRIAHFIESGELPQASSAPQAKTSQVPTGGEHHQRLCNDGTDSQKLLESARLAKKHDDWTSQECRYLHDMLQKHLNRKEKTKHKPLLKELKQKFQ